MGMLMDDTSDSDEEIFRVRPKITAEMYTNSDRTCLPPKNSSVPTNKNEANTDDKNSLLNTICKPVTVNLTRLSDTQIRDMLHGRKSELNRNVSRRRPNKRKKVQRKKAAKSSARQRMRRQSTNKTECHENVQIKELLQRNNLNNKCPPLQAKVPEDPRSNPRGKKIFHNKRKVFGGKGENSIFRVEKHTYSPFKIVKHQNLNEDNIFPLAGVPSGTGADKRQRKDISIQEDKCLPLAFERKKDSTISTKNRNVKLKRNMALEEMRQRLLELRGSTTGKDSKESEDSDMEEAFKKNKLGKWKFRRKRNIIFDSESSDSEPAEHGQSAVKNVYKRIKVLSDESSEDEATFYNCLTNKESDQSVASTPETINKRSPVLRVILTKLKNEKTSPVTNEVRDTERHEEPRNFENLQSCVEEDGNSTTVDEDVKILPSAKTSDDSHVLNQTKPVICDIQSPSKPTNTLIREHQIHCNPKVVLIRLESLMIPSRESYSASEIEHITVKYVDFLMNSNFASRPRNSTILRVRGKGLSKSALHHLQTDTDATDKGETSAAAEVYESNLNDSTSSEWQRSSPTLESAREKTLPGNPEQHLLSVWKEAFCANKKQNLLPRERESDESTSNADRSESSARNKTKNTKTDSMQNWSKNFKRWLPGKPPALPAKVTRPTLLALKTPRTAAASADETACSNRNSGKVENRAVTIVELRNHGDKETSRNLENDTESNTDKKECEGENPQVSTPSDQSEREQVSSSSGISSLEKETPKPDLPRQGNHNLPIGSSAIHTSPIEQSQQVPCESSNESIDISVQSEEEIPCIRLSPDHQLSCPSAELDLLLEQTDVTSPIEAPRVQDPVKEISPEQSDEGRSSPTHARQAAGPAASPNKRTEQLEKVKSIPAEMPGNTTTCTPPKDSATTNDSRENVSFPSESMESIRIAEAQVDANESDSSSSTGNLVIVEETESASSNTSCVAGAGCSTSLTASSNEIERSGAREKTVKNHPWWMRHYLQQSNRLNSFQCHVCLLDFESKEDLATHLYRHTSEELQQVYENAKAKSLYGIIDAENTNIMPTSNKKKKEEEEEEKSKSKAIKRKEKERPKPRSRPRPKKRTNEKTQRGKDTVGEKKTLQSRVDEYTKKKYLPILPATSITSICSANSPRVIKSITICRCHRNDTLSTGEDILRMEMVLLCRLCQVLFRSMECFETHYRTEPLCSQDRSYGRSPKIFCSGCRVILNSLQDMRHHLEMHLKRQSTGNRQASMTVICNICKVFFFGVGVLFHTHWLHHVKNPFFVASRLSFPRTSVIQHTANSKMMNSADPFVKSIIGDYLLVAEYVCRDCRTPFCIERDLRRHVQMECAEARRYYQLMLETDTKFDTPKPCPSPVEMICGDCDEAFYDRLAYEQHAYRHNEEHQLQPQYITVSVTAVKSAFICQICANVFETLKELGDHWSHHVDVRKDFICTRCNARFPSFDEFIKHAKNYCVRKMLSPSCKVSYHRPEHNCVVCHLVFESQQSLNEHLVLHGQNDKYAAKESLVIAKLMESVASPPPTAAVGVGATEQNQSEDTDKTVRYASVPQIILVEDVPPGELPEAPVEKQKSLLAAKLMESSVAFSPPAAAVGVGATEQNQSEDTNKTVPQIILVEDLPPRELPEAPVEKQKSLLAAKLMESVASSPPTAAVGVGATGQSPSENTDNTTEYSSVSVEVILVEDYPPRELPEVPVALAMADNNEETREEEGKKGDSVSEGNSSSSKDILPSNISERQTPSAEDQPSILPESVTREVPYASAGIAADATIAAVTSNVEPNGQDENNDVQIIASNCQAKDQNERGVSERNATNVTNPEPKRGFLRVRSLSELTEKKQYQECSVCGIVFDSLTKFNQHLAAHAADCESINLQQQQQQQQQVLPGEYTAEPLVANHADIAVPYRPAFKETSVAVLLTNNIDRATANDDRNVDQAASSQLPSANVPAVKASGSSNPQERPQAADSHVKVSAKTNYKIRCKFCPSFRCYNKEQFNVHERTPGHVTRKGLYKQWQSKENARRRTAAPEAPPADIAFPQMQEETNASNSQLLHDPLANVGQPRDLNEVLQDLIEEWSGQGQAQGQIPQERTIQSSVRPVHVVQNDAAQNPPYHQQSLSNVNGNPSSNNEFNPLFMDLPVSEEAASHQQTNRWQNGGAEDSVAFACLYCTTPMHFANSELLYQHIAKDHNFLCDMCGYRVYTSNDLDIHKTMHGNIWVNPFSY